MKKTKKPILFFLLTILIVTSFGLFDINSAKAATTIDEKKLENTPIQTVNKQSALDDYLDGQSYTVLKDDGKLEQSDTDGAVGSFAKAFTSQFLRKESILVNEDGTPVTSAGGAQIYLTKPGAIASALNYTDVMRQTPPASGVIYAQGEWNKITKGYKAEAAATNSWVYYPGLGFNLLNPIEKYWIVSRNIAYIAMIFIMVLVAFLVAFRSNFGGQTQVTIANSIPNIILALVMISISFPLSGFAIDLITIGTNAAQQVLVQNTFSPGYEDVWSQDSISKLMFVNSSLSTDKTIGEKGNPVKNFLQPDDSQLSVWQIFSTANVNVMGKNEAVATIIPSQGFVGGAIENILKEFADAGVVNAFFQLVFVVAAFMASLKLFFKLLGKYITLILYPIVSPFIMLTVAIPGRGAKTITSYFRSLVSASLSFVAVYAVFLFMIVLGHDTHLSGSFSYMPPLLGYDAVSSGTGTALGDYAKMLLAFGLFLSTPAIPDLIDSSLNVISFNEIRSGQVLRSQLLQGTTPGQPPGMLGPGGLVGGALGAKNLVGRVWTGAEKTVGYDSKKEQKK